MAKITLQGYDEYVEALSRLAAADQEEVAGKAIYAGAKIVADEASARLDSVLSGEGTGALAESFGISKMQTDANGDRNVKLGFDGYDSKGVANQLKGRVLESGSSKQKKRPFMRPAVVSTKGAAIAKMGEVLNAEIAKKMNK